MGGFIQKCLGSDSKIGKFKRSTFRIFVLQWGERTAQVISGQKNHPGVDGNSPNWKRLQEFLASINKSTIEKRFYSKSSGF